MTQMARCGSRLGRGFLASLVVLLVSQVSASASAEPKNLLAGLSPMKSKGVKHVERLTDNLMCNEGDGWHTDITSRFTSSRSFVDFDLGSPQTIRCVMVQADNNDVYFMSGSLDGQQWQQVGS